MNLYKYTQGYNNIILSLSKPSDFYYVRPDQRKYIYTKEWVNENINENNKYDLHTKHSIEFPYKFIILLKYIRPTSDLMGGNQEYECEIYNPKSELGENKILCIPCDMFGLIPNDAYFNFEINLDITNWGKCIKKSELRLAGQNTATTKFVE